MGESNRTTEERSLDGVAEVQAMIAKFPEAGQRRIAVVAEILRDLLERDSSGESMLAFTLVLAEVSQ
jgi:hypothetical protein